MESIYKPSNLYETLKINYKEELNESEAKGERAIASELITEGDYKRSEVVKSCLLSSFHVFLNNLANNIALMNTHIHNFIIGNTTTHMPTHL